MSDITPLDFHEFRTNSKKWLTPCIHGKECQHGEGCNHVCESNSPIMRNLKQALCRSSNTNLILLAENQALRAQLRAQTKSSSKKGGKKSFGADDNVVYPPVSTLNQIINHILSKGRCMTSAEIGQEAMNNTDLNPSKLTLKNIFLHLKKTKQIVNDSKITSVTKYISSLPNVVEGEKRGTLRTFCYEVQEEVASAKKSAPEMEQDSK